MFPCIKAKFPVFSLSGKSKNQIPCFPCAVATLKLIFKSLDRVDKLNFLKKKKPHIYLQQ